MQYRMLGPVGAFANGAPVEIPQRRILVLLAVLLLQRGAVVHVARAIDLLWGEEPPANPHNALQQSVSRLRRALGPGVIVRRGSGYALPLAADALDVARFEALAARGAGELGAGEPAVAADVYRHVVREAYETPSIVETAPHRSAVAQMRLEEVADAAVPQATARLIREGRTRSAPGR